MISEKTIERVRNLNIEDVLKPYVTLQKKAHHLWESVLFILKRQDPFR